MFMKNTGKNNRWLLLLVALLVLAVVALLWEKYTREKPRGLDLKAAIKPCEDQLSNINQLLYADELLFEGKIEEARAQYQTLSQMSSKASDSLLQSRIAYANQLIQTKEQTPLMASVNTRRYVSKDSLTYLKQKYDSTSRVVAIMTDSMNKKIETLNRQLRDRNRVLEQKGGLQAIVIKNTQGATIHYVGETKNGKANGQGTGVWEKSGGVYKGEWKDNIRHGSGEYTWSDGERYTGEWNNDLKEGKGHYFWPSGERYEGSWVANRRNGDGTMYNKDGNVIYKGEWENDKPKSK
jgi:hypothetical protein